MFNYFFQKLWYLLDNVENYFRARQASSYDVIGRTKYAICIPES
jgi:hypothetical protein